MTPSSLSEPQRRPALGATDGKAPVLIVDDYPPNLLALQATLDSDALRLVSATSGEEALKLAELEEFAAIVMDVQMPGLSGVETVRYLRQGAGSRYVPIILLTARDSDDQEVFEAYSQGAVDYLRKPFVPAVLRAKVSVFVDLFVAREEVKRQAALLQKQKEVESQEQKALLHLIIEQSGEGIVMADARGVLRVFNPAAERMHGATKQEVEAPDWSKTYSLFNLHGEPLPLEETPLFRAVQGEVVEHTAWKVKRPDGQVRVLGGSATPLTHSDGTRAGGVLVMRDETEKLSLEEQRAEAHAERERFFRLAPDLFCIAGVDAYFKRVNDSFPRTLGWSEEELCRKPFLEFVHPEDRASTLKEVEKLAEGATTIRFENRYRCKDDSFKWLAWAATPVPERGLIYAAARDITEQKRAQALQARQAQHALLIGDIGAALTGIDSLAAVLQRCTEAMVHHLDAALARIWTLNEAEAMLELQASAGLYTHLDGPHSRVPVGRFKIGLIAEQGKSHLTNNVLGDDRVGDKEWAQREGMVAFAGYPLLLQGRTVGVLALFARRALEPDVLDALAAVADSVALGIERARAEKARSESAQQFRTLADSIPQLAWTANADGHIFWYNQRWYDFTGTRLEDMQGWGWKSVHDPKLLDWVVEEWMASLRTGTAFEMQFPLRRYDGVFRWHLTRATPVRDAAGAIVQWFGTNTDIDDERRVVAELKQAQEDIRALNADLERRVKERTAELQEANNELESFTYSVSHDLRAPLRHITGFGQLLEKRAASALDEKSLAYVRTMSEAAQKGGQLVDDLLAFSRLGRAELKKASVDLPSLVTEVQSELAPDMEGRNVTWKVEPLPTVQADANLLRAALKNLLSNALKYSRTKPEVVIEIGTHEHASELEVFVRDNGVGFNMQYVDKLFGVFQRLHTAEQFEGTGIGLANVRRIIQRHGGRVWAKGTPGEGAAFHFTLPWNIAASGNGETL